MDDNSKKDYIKLLLTLLEEDKKAVLLYVIFNFSLVTLSLNEKIFKNSDQNGVFSLIGICLLIISGYLYFDYFRKLHLSAYKVAETILILDTDEAKKIKEQIWLQNKTRYTVAYVSQISGVVLLLIQYMVNINN